MSPPKPQTTLIIPPPALCTDNGAMIAWAGAERLALGLIDTMDAAAPRALAARRQRDGAGGLCQHARGILADRCRRSNPSRVIGAGAWGTALAGVAARAGRDVVLYARNAGMPREIAGDARQSETARRAARCRASR